MIQLRVAGLASGERGAEIFRVSENVQFLRREDTRKSTKKRSSSPEVHLAQRGLYSNQPTLSSCLHTSRCCARRANERKKALVMGIIKQRPSEVTLLVANTFQPSITPNEESN